MQTRIEGSSPKLKEGNLVGFCISVSERNGCRTKMKLKKSFESERI